MQRRASNIISHSQKHNDRPSCPSDIVQDPSRRGSKATTRHVPRHADQGIQGELSSHRHHLDLSTSSHKPGPTNAPHRQDGKPYIVECNAGRLYDDSRNQGFTVSAVSKFASMRDFEFYDKECKAHQELRAFAQSVAEGYCMSYYHPIKLAEPKI